MSLKSNLNGVIAAVLFGAGLLPSVASSHIPIPPKEPSQIGRQIVKKTVADFKLTDQDGKPFKFSDTRGKLVLVTFIFTTCPDVCPLLTAKLAAIQRTLEEKNIKDYFLVSITTDPERDTTAALKEYAGHFKADFRRWSFLTDSRQEMAKIWKLFDVNVTKNESGQVRHTSLTTLIDRQGNRRVDYYGDKWNEKEVIKDIESLASVKK
jgi:protein SCO1